MKFKADEIASVIRQEIEQYQSEIDVRQVGRVLEVGDGIARVYGLSGVMSGEMVAFPGGVHGLAFNLEENSIGVIILGDFLDINEGDEVRSTGRLLSVPVGEAGRAAVDRTLRHLHLVAGISYYKAAVPPEIAIIAASINAMESGGGVAEGGPRGSRWKDTARREGTGQ